MPVIWTQRTEMEKYLIGGAAAYVAWQAYRLGYHKRAADLSSAIIPGVQAIRDRFGPLKLVVDRTTVTGCKVMESRRNGSNESQMTVPEFQCKIGYKQGIKFVVLGGAVRFDGMALVAPDHVLCDTAEEKFCYGKQGYLSLKNKPRITLDTDLVMIILTEAEFSQIGIRSNKIHYINRDGEFAAIVGPENLGTTGVLRHDANCFGKVTYDGSTLAGYSGFPYTAGGNCIAGTHQFGGNVNGGYNASYIWMLIRLELKMKFEDSGDWLLGEFKAGKVLRWKHHPNDFDLVQVCANGRYSVVEVDSMQKAFGDDWRETNEIHYSNSNKRTYMDHTEYESASPSGSGESLGSKLPGALSLIGNSQDSTPRNAQELMNVFNKLSPSRLFFCKLFI